MVKNFIYFVKVGFFFFSGGYGKDYGFWIEFFLGGSCRCFGGG